MTRPPNPASEAKRTQSPAPPPDGRLREALERIAGDVPLDPEPKPVPQSPRSLADAFQTIRRLRWEARAALDETPPQAGQGQADEEPWRITFECVNADEYAALKRLLNLPVVEGFRVADDPAPAAPQSEDGRGDPSAGDIHDIDSLNDPDFDSAPAPQTECPTCGSDDPAMCRWITGFDHRGGAGAAHRHRGPECCPDGFHTPATPGQGDGVGAGSEAGLAPPEVGGVCWWNPETGVVAHLGPGGPKRHLKATPGCVEVSEAPGSPWVLLVPEESQ